MFNPSTPELNPSAQSCLTGYVVFHCHHMSVMDFVVSLLVVAEV
jgi:hypothetical protein